MYLATTGMSPALPLQSIDGQALLQRSYDARTTSKSVVDAYVRQEHQFSSGIASLVVLINAINVAYRIKYDQVEERSRINDLLGKGQRITITEEDIFVHSKVAKYLSENGLTRSKLSLAQLQNVALYLGFGSNAYYSCIEGACKANDETNERLKSILGQQSEHYTWNSVEDFRSFAKDHIMSIVTGLIVNYDQKMLGEEREGAHFSPLAGYDKDSDRFLVMDVGNDGDGVWVKAQDLYKAMSVANPATDVPRGCLHVHELLV